MGHALDAQQFRSGDPALYPRPRPDPHNGKIEGQIDLLVALAPELFQIGQQLLGVFLA